MAPLSMRMILNPGRPSQFSSHSGHSHPVPSGFGVEKERGLSIRTAVVL